MSQVNSKNPNSPLKVRIAPSLNNDSLSATHFDIYGVGGYMEVYNISDLYFTVPTGTTGQVYYSGNTIPINFYKGSGYSYNSLILNSDNISSGRRKLGMLVYVYETDQIYQFKINNYDSLWSAATASTGSVVSTQYGTVVQGNSSENNSFINAWTGNTIEGISGGTSSNSVWKKLVTGSGGGSGITGGTYYQNTLTLDLLSTGGTISIGDVTGLYISAGTYTSGTSTLNLFNSTGGTISITGITAGSGSGGTSNLQYFISGSSPTGTINNGDRWFYTESGEEFVWITDQDGSQWVQPVSISYGVSEEFVHITGDTMTGTLYAPTISATTYQNLPGSSSSNCVTTFYVTNVSGCSPVNMLTEVNMLSGLTVTGNGYFTGVVTATTISATTYQNYPTNFTSGLTATTISATTYENLPTDIRTTGATYSNNTFTFTNNTGGTYSVLFNTVTGLTATTISATTYQNLPSQSGTGVSTLSYTPTTGILTLTKNDTTTLTAGTFTYLTGISYSNNVVTLTNNLGTSSNVTINTVTGLTVNGNLTATGTTTSGTISATTYQNLPTDIRTTGATYTNNIFTFTNNTGGTYSVLFNTVTGLTVNGVLTVTGNTSSQSLTLSNSASTISLNNTTQQQIIFYAGGTGTPTYTNYSAGAKIIFSDNIGASSAGYAIGVDAGSLWYGVDLAGNGHDWYAGTNKIASLISSAGFQLFGLGSPTSVAFTISGTSALGSKGGLGYMDFLRVYNNYASATNPNKWFRTTSGGTLQILRDDYGATIFDLTNNGIMSVGGGNLATTTSNDGTSNYLSFGNNGSQIYDDGNFHIHNRNAGASLWINTNGAQLNLLTQSPTSTGSIGTGIAIATTTLNGYVTINTGRTITTSASYGYLINSASPTGQYGGGSQSLSISLYANNRIWGQEIDAFSDERMKDIQGEISLEEGIKLVKNLKPIKYTWKEGDDKGLKAGYSAQQVIKSGFDHLIGLIPTKGLEERIDDDGFVSPKDTQFAMNYDQVTPYHGIVIKHLLEEIENLKKEIKDLKSKIK